MTVRLEPHPIRKPPRGPVICVVMDGVGIGAADDGDMVHHAHTPTIDWLRGLPSATVLAAHGVAVGMPSDADMGNSEVGHNALGAGRVFDQGAKRVNEAVCTKAMFEGDTWAQAIATVKRSEQPLHLLGLVSDGNVHSHLDHLLAMISRAAEDGVRRLRVHALLDGRDTPARSALGYLKTLEDELQRQSAQGLDYRIASGGGRMQITMDRYEADWGMVHRGWNAHVHGQARAFTSAAEAVQTLYEETGKGDQDLPAFVIAEGGKPVGPIEDGAAVLMFNFRGDRAIEISKAFEQDDFEHFDRGRRPEVFYAGMMQYDGDELVPARFLVTPPEIGDTMGELLSRAGQRQLAIAETQKFGHVTYFWNGNKSGAFDETLERYLEIPSDPFPFEQRPWMKAAEVTDRIIAELDAQPYHFVRVNYANGDMVGHTGHVDATRIAVQTVDLCLQRLVETTRRVQGVLMVTADHGNADQMFDVAKDGSRSVRTSHSLHPVMLSIFDPRVSDGGPRLRDVDGAGLANVAATALELLGFRPPEAYAPSLLAPM